MDLDLWCKVGWTWAESMLDPGIHTQPEEPHEGDSREGVLNASGGSVEGLGGLSGCQSREVELELLVGELKQQVVKLTRENTALRETLTISEEQAAGATVSLMDVKKMEGSKVQESEGMEDRKLLLRVEELEVENEKKKEDVERLECLVTKLKEQLDETHSNLDTVNICLEEETRECLGLKKKIHEMTVTAAKDMCDDDDTTDEDESERSLLRQEIQKLKMELTMKEEEVKLFTDGTLVGEPSDNQTRSSNLSFSLIHDLSVDDRVIEEVMRTSAKPLNITPSRRGPSASSTPQKTSIMEELQGLRLDFPLPFCEKVDLEEGHLAVCPKAQVLKLQEQLGEKMRKLVCDQVVEGRTGQVMAAINLAFSDCRVGTLQCLQGLYETAVKMNSDISSSECCNCKKEQTENCSHIYPDISEVSSDKKEVKNGTTETDVETENNPMVAARTPETSPNTSLGIDIDMTGWNLDLEGIQLIETGRPSVGRRAQYHPQGSRDFSTEAKEAVLKLEKNPWLTFYHVMKELHSQAQRSRYVNCTQQR